MNEDKKKQLSWSLWGDSRMEYDPSSEKIVYYFRQSSTYDRGNLGWQSYGIWFNNSKESRKESQKIIAHLRFWLKIVSFPYELRDLPYRIRSKFLKIGKEQNSYLSKNIKNSYIQGILRHVCHDLNPWLLPEECSTKEFLVYSLREFYKKLVSKDNVTFAKDFNATSKEREEIIQNFIKRSKAENEKLLEAIDHIDKNYDFDKHKFINN